MIGGSAAAGVVFTRDVTAATRSDARVVALEERIEAAEDAAEAGRLRGELSSLLETVRSEKMGELAAKFDSIHSIQRAVEVGSVSSIVAAGDLRPYLIDAIERGMKKTEPTTEVEHRLSRVASGGRSSVSAARTSKSAPVGISSGPGTASLAWVRRSAAASTSSAIRESAASGWWRFWRVPRSTCAIRSRPTARSASISIAISTP